MFGKLFRKQYPSSGWRRKASLSIDVDLDRGELCGVPLGRSMDDLSFLGPADDSKQAREGVLCYFSLGLEVRVAGATVNEITLILADVLGDGYEPFQGPVKCSGRTHVLTPETNEEQAVRLFGTPARRYETRDKESGDLEELTLSYSSGDTTWELILGGRKTLEEVRIVYGGIA